MLQNLRHLLLLIAVFVAACDLSAEDVDLMTKEQIEKLANLTGNNYLAQRNAFLAVAEPLPEFNGALSDADPRYRIQYLILRGWQNHGSLYQQIDAELAQVPADFVSKKAAGFHPIWNEYARLTKEDWQEQALPYAWENIWKFGGIRPEWQVTNSLFMVRGYPHEDSIDALLIGIFYDRGSKTPTYTSWLREMPKAGLEMRLDEPGSFYVAMRPRLVDALRGR